ncbi:hypothetical protein VIM7927_00647 [Vibrio mangrovi]|uniref:Uncharacterized protein n=1 Tax=Vibrio mangrovi TaxID=474394 RepID=A0A1Y6ISE2_9VIBR|nr:hypothetical protein VIM7927_00647 [Vibrio mangrovi]
MNNHKIILLSYGLVHSFQIIKVTFSKAIQQNPEVLSYLHRNPFRPAEIVTKSYLTIQIAVNFG